jgi:hypothetical protein
MERIAKITLFISLFLLLSLLSTNLNAFNHEVEYNNNKTEEKSRLRRAIEMIKSKSDQSLPDVRLVKRQVVEIRDLFLKAVEQEGHKNKYVPEVEVILTSNLMFFAGDTNEGFVVAPNWKAAPVPMKQMFDKWMKESGCKYSGEEFFKKNFNWFLVAHELGHFLQKTQKGVEPTNATRWDSEIQANEIAVAFWLKCGKEAELKSFIEQTTKLMNYLKASVPKNFDKEYFNKNYRELAKNPAIYGYVQFLMYKKAWDKRAELNSVVPVNK